MSVYDNTKLYLPLALLPNGKKSIMNMDNNIELGRWIRERIADGTIPVTVSSVAWSVITGTPTTLVGYGITDGLSTTTTYSGDVSGTYNTMVVDWSNGSSTYDTLYYPLSSNPNAYLTSITSSDIITALGYIPYNSTNPSGFITSSALTPYLTISNAASTYYPLSNPNNYITNSALTPYLTSATAASTYQTLAGMSSYLTTSTAASTYVPLTRTITINGTTFDLSANRSWTIGSSSGVCGISNSSGVYTFYTTLQDALNAVTTGQTVEIFSNITLAAGLTLGVSCNINFNGYNVTLTSAATNTLTLNSPGTDYNFYNGSLTHIGTGANTGCVINAIGGARINCYAFNINFTTTTVANYAVKFNNVSSYLRGAVINISNQGGGISSAQSSTAVYNCNIYGGTGIGIIGCQGGISFCNIDMNNTTGNAGLTISGGFIHNCSSISRGAGNAVITNSGTINNSAFINTSNGITAGLDNLPILNNCVITSTNERAVFGSSFRLYGCTIRSLGLGVIAVSVNGDTITLENSSVTSNGVCIQTISNGGAVLTNTRIINNTLRSLQNTNDGHCITLVGSGLSGSRIQGNHLTVTNSGAYCVRATGASTSKINGNNYNGTATPLNLLTPEPVTIDIYGNITN